jgi:signal transduction histidine kinase
MVSHELKTPVTSIKGYIQMLLSMLQDTDETGTGIVPVKSSLNRIDEQIKRLTRLITEMLDLSKLEESKLHLKKEKLVLNELVKETVQDIEFTNKTHRIHIQNLFSGSVYVDKDRIQQVIVNLVNNGIKYSPRQTDINICIAQKIPGTIEVSVQDFGIGISQEEQEKIFDRFYRVDGKLEITFAGFGIGLYITREILAKHDGMIQVASEPGKGSVFTFTLPLTS